MTRSRSTTRLVGGALAVLALAACGSTVQQTTSLPAQVADGSGLGPGGATDGSTGEVTSVGASSAPVADGTTGAVSVGSTGAVGPVGSTTGAVTAPDVETSRGPKGPLEVGVLLTPTGSAAEYGVDTGESYSEQQVDDALFKAINAQGGLLGRKVVPVYAKTDPNASNWAVEYAAACATFTQDHKVAAVLGYVFNYDQAFETCLTNKGVPHLMTGFNVPDAKELARHPLHRALAVPTIDHRSLAKLEGAWQDGHLTTKSVLGVVLDGCPGTRSSWDRVSLPWLKAHGVKVGSVFEPTGCNTGNNADAAAGVNQVPNGIVKMRQAGVDVLSFLTVSEGPALLIVATAAESQGWRPTYLTSSLANLSTLEGAAPQGQMQNVKSYGWMPSQDVSFSLQPPKTAGQKRCLELLKRGNVVPTAFGDLNNAYRICDAVFAYEAAVLRSGAVTGAALVAGLDALGSAFSNPDVLEGATLFGKGRENVAPARMRSVEWSADCGCFTYTRKVRPLP